MEKLISSYHRKHSSVPRVVQQIEEEKEEGEKRIVRRTEGKSEEAGNAEEEGTGSGHKDEKECLTIYHLEMRFFNAIGMQKLSS